MGEDNVIDQSQLAEDLSSKIKYNFLDYFLVKPLDPIKVKKTFSKPVSNSKPNKDATGIEAIDYDTVETEVKEVDSDYRRGVVLKRPLYYETSDVVGTEHEIKIGDIIVFRDAAGSTFDLLKDSKLIRQYDVIAIES